ncbi:hypothetical protein F8M49_06115 [Rhodococcus zopfii]|uniref:DUF6745 domain-containing protein n=1 Tax=Rhodococcus zopfii TaxID=43772 RepID=A0ABU3WM79_9NOCA|nr:hypothetical protein [Rhodococcus zopfii]
MTAVATTRAVEHRVPSHGTAPHDLLSDVRELRDHWLARGLSTRPADRSVAECAVSELYRRSGFDPPEFLWVPSPAAASALIPELTLRAPSSALDDTHPSVRIASLLSASRARMDERIRRRYPPSSRFADPGRTYGPPLNPEQIIRLLMWNSLRTTLFDAVATAIRRTLPQPVGTVSWYGQQEAHRVGYYDAIRRCGLVGFGGREDDLLDVQAALVGATGWWWAFERVCVMTERPSELHTEPNPGGAHGERRLHHSDRAALEYPDGAKTFVNHGTIVPEWVVLDPSAERIGRERNVEIRRCAIERIGWDAYIDAAGLTLVDRAEDPGNPGCLLELYERPGAWGPPGRILLAVNGSVERDGTRRRYGLPVPAWAPSALDAAGWTYGISGSDYSRLVRRT